MMCGKMAAGKSTLATQLAQSPNTVLLSEDAWLHSLFGDQMTTPADFMRFSARLRDAVGPHVVGVLAAGVSVVLDFQANTRASRAWMRSLLQQGRADHRLHVLVPPDEVCLARLHARNARGEHPFSPTEAQFHAFSRHFELPTPDEGFHLVTHTQGA